MDDGLSSSGLHRDDAHAMRDDVVHLACDADALLGDGAFGCDETVALCAFCSTFGIGEQPLAVSDHASGDGCGTQVQAHREGRREVFGFLSKDGERRGGEEHDRCGRDCQPGMAAIRCVRGDRVDRHQPDDGAIRAVVPAVVRQGQPGDDGEHGQARLSTKDQSRTGPGEQCHTDQVGLSGAVEMLLAHEFCVGDQDQEQRKRHIDGTASCWCGRRSNR